MCNYEKEARQLVTEGEIQFCGWRIKLVKNWNSETTVTIPIGCRGPIIIAIPPDEPVNSEKVSEALADIAQREGAEEK